MNTHTSKKIIDYIKLHGQARAHTLHKVLTISRTAIHKQLKRLLDGGFIVRVGKPPIVFYTLPQESETEIQSQQLPVREQKLIDANFLSITPNGKLLYGMAGFEYWAQNYQKNKPIATVAEEYTMMLKTQRKIFSSQGWIDATSKLHTSFRETPIAHLFFGDIYSYPVFGRTKLAKLVMYAKQTGELNLIKQIGDLVKPLIDKIIDEYAIETVAFIPPTVPRPVQFINELRFNLNLQLPEIELVKVVPGDIPVAQKTLASLRERVINAKDSIYLKENNVTYKNILLIDDVAGSGASFNETAKKIKNNLRSKNIFAFGLVGNIRGYDIVREI
jgi:biotin operon repressor